MFYDERINSECGKIYRRGILLATLVALLYGAVHAVYLISIDRFLISYLLTELVIVAVGAGILLVGAFRFPGRGDERQIAERHDYYLRAGKLFVIAALGGYGISIPFSIGKMFGNVGDRAANELILVLEVLGVMYLFYCFKRRDINFNYSFIAENKSKYYYGVLINIGKLAGVLAGVYLVAAVLDLAVNHTLGSLLVILLAYVESAVGLGLEYLFISWVEKVSYDEEMPRGLKKSTVIVGVTFIIVQIIWSAFTMWYYSIAANADLMAQTGVAVGEHLAAASVVRKQMAYVVNVVSAMFWCHVMTQTRGSKSVRCGIAGSLLLTAISTVQSALVSYIIIFGFEPFQYGTAVRDIAEFSNITGYIIMFASIALMFLTACGLVRDVRLSGVLFVLPAAQLASKLLLLFLYSQSLIMLQGIVECVSAVGITVAWILLLKWQYKDANLG